MSEFAKADADVRANIEMVAWRKLQADHAAALDRIRELKAALQAIAVGMLPEDRAASSVHMYKLCASRLCGIARDAIIADGRGGGAWVTRFASSGNVTTPKPEGSEKL